MTMLIPIRVRAKTEEFAWRKLWVATDGSLVTCGCGGRASKDAADPDDAMCSHIDAVLIAGETGMIHYDDMERVKAARAVLDGRLRLPPDWHRAWMANLDWRGIMVGGEIEAHDAAQRNERDWSKRQVCFTGTFPGHSRPDLIADAQAAGFEVTNVPSRFTDYLVAADPRSGSAKLAKAERFGTVILSYDEWRDFADNGVLPDDEP